MLIYGFSNFDFVSESKIATFMVTRFVCLHYNVVLLVFVIKNANLIWSRLNVILRRVMYWVTAKDSVVV